MMAHTSTESDSPSVGLGPETVPRTTTQDTIDRRFRTDSVPSTVGTYLARRMLDLGVRDYFVVPGDFNLVLLDEILRFPELRLVSCCNELNAGYAADGYARARGVAVLIVTFTVGSLSAINAIAGAYSQDLPLVVIAGGPNSLDYASDRVLHHTTGEMFRQQELLCFKQVTVKALEVRHPRLAPSLIDEAFATALREKKPVFLSVACNIATSPVALPIPFDLGPLRASNPKSLKAAIKTLVDMWGKSVNPVIVAGAKTRTWNGVEPLRRLAEAAECGVAVMADAKGVYPETDPNFMGIFWGNISSPATAAVVDSADMQIFIGPLFNDYNTVGYTAMIKRASMVEITRDRVKTPQGEYGCVYMAEFLTALAKTISPKNASLKTFARLRTQNPLPAYVPGRPDAPLETRNIAHAVQGLLGDTVLVVETGDSWFHGMKLPLPANGGFEIQMQYGSIGWSVGAVLGLAIGHAGPVAEYAPEVEVMSAGPGKGAGKTHRLVEKDESKDKESVQERAEENLSSEAIDIGESVAEAGGVDLEGKGKQDFRGDFGDGGEGKKKRVVAMIGDGSFQVTGQEVSTMIRYGLDPIIFLINNKGYTIEVQIHDGLYNNIKNWEYASLVDVFNAGEGRGRAWKVATEEQLTKAVEEARAHNGMCLIECLVDRNDCTLELLEFGTRVSAANSRQTDIM